MRSLIVLTLFSLGGCAAPPSPRTDAMNTPLRRLTIELLALDLDTCGRCTGTGANLDAAIATVAGVLREADVEVDVRKTVVSTARQAEELRFESSPTIRINGRDIALDLRESNCGDCGDICGCEGQVDCRVWVWQGREYTEAPKALIIDAVLRVYSHAWEPTQPSREFRLPDNLRNFFAATAAKAAPRPADACCDTAACCEPAAKAACCGVQTDGETCGCKG